MPGNKAATLLSGKSFKATVRGLCLHRYRGCPFLPGVYQVSDPGRDACAHLLSRLALERGEERQIQVSHVPIAGGHSGHRLLALPPSHSPPALTAMVTQLSLGCSHPEFQSMAESELEPAQPELTQSLCYTSVAKSCPSLAKLGVLHWPNHVLHWANHALH